MRRPAISVEEGIHRMTDTEIPKPTQSDTEDERIMRKMIPFLLFTDVSLLIYWTISGVMLMGFELIPVEYLYNDYHNPLMYAWNWSFFPLDMVLAIAGLLGVRLFRAGNPAWYPTTLFSIALTFCAGFMAVSFWAITKDFDPSWWIPNLFFAVWPLIFLKRFLSARRAV